MADEHLPQQLSLFAGAVCGLRWRERSNCWRSDRAVIDPQAYVVEALGFAEAKAFVCRHHYAGTMPAARICIGLRHRDGDLHGVAVFSVPASEGVLPRYIEGASNASAVELGRFALLDDVPGNGESWFLGRCWRHLRQQYSWVRWVLSFSDPQPRYRLDGTCVMPGHVGRIYQATNGQYLGRSKPKALLLGPDGRALSPRALSKLRTGDQGAAYAERQVAAVAGDRRPGESAADWLKRLQDEGALRAMAHPGCHAYAWAVREREDLKACRIALPYPRAVAA